MIKANELRLGNWLNINGSPAPIQAGWFSVIASHQEHLLPPHSPIPLTPEILEKCGFVDAAKTGLAYRLYLNNTDEICYYLSDGFLRYQTQMSGFTRSLLHGKYIHQLQNFYFALTGEELEIKL